MKDENPYEPGTEAHFAWWALYKRKLLDLDKVRKYICEHGREVSLAQVAAGTGLSVEDVALALDEMQREDGPAPCLKCNGTGYAEPAPGFTFGNDCPVCRGTGWLPPAGPEATNAR